MKKLIFCAVGVAMFSNVANAATCKDFDDDMNLVEYECGTSLSAAIKANKEKEEAEKKAKEVKKSTTTSENQGASGPNVIVGNPLYMPKAGHFYSETALSSHSEATKDWALGEEFGFGISDELAISVKTGLAEGAEDFVGGDDEMFDTYGWTHLGVNATFRAFQDGNIVADVYGGVEAGGTPGMWLMPGGGLFYHSDAEDDSWWFDKDWTGYTWTAGVRGGYVSSLFTVAGHFEYSYVNSEMFNWGDAGLHMMSLGLDGQFVIDPSWNLVAGVEYTGITNDHLAYDDLESPADNENSGVWTGYFGVNYNIDATKYVGAYVNGTMKHWKDNGEKGWEAEDGFGFGVKFGVQF